MSDTTLLLHGRRRAQPQPKNAVLGISVAWFSAWPWWVRVLGVYAASRVVTSVMVGILAATGELASSHTRDYLAFASLWDGAWYEHIALFGYPASLPTDLHGTVLENAWAFMPAYPFVCRAIMTVTGLPFSAVAVGVSLVCGAGASLMVFKLMRTRLGQATSLFTVVLFCVAPVSPLFQMAYAEAAYLFLLAVALFLLVRRNYAWLFPVIGIMALTRPSGLAFALLMALHTVYRFVVRNRDPFPARERALCAALAVFSTLSGFAWPLIAATVTGSITAYTDTELAWRSPYIGVGELVPFTSWFQGAHWWFTDFLLMPPWVGPLVVLCLIAIFALILLSPAARRLGTDMRLWCASYGIYLLAVFFPQSSTFRLLAPLFPLWGVVAQLRGAWIRVGVVVLCFAAQWWWILVCWRISAGDWSPP